MKNLVALLMLLSVGMFIVGCGETTSAPSGNGGEAEAPATEDAGSTTTEAAAPPEGQPADDEDDEEE